MDYMNVNEMADNMNSPILLIHDSCSEGVFAVFPPRKMVTVLANFRSLGYSKIVVKSDQRTGNQEHAVNVG